MDEIKEMFEGVNWDNIMTVVADYVTPIDVSKIINDLFSFFMNVVGVFLGDLISF